MAKKKVEVFLEEEEIEFLKKINLNRSQAIRKCVLEKKKSMSRN